MIDIVLEILQAIVVGIILLMFLRMGSQKGISSIVGWRHIVFGFALLLFGVVIDISDNFEGLSRFVVIGNTPVQAFLEKVIGYLVGFVFIAYGIWRWLPKIIEHTELKELELQVSQERLKVLHATMRTVQDIFNNFLANVQLFRLKAERTSALDSESLVKIDAVIQDAAEKIQKLGNLKDTPEKLMATGIGIDFENNSYEEQTQKSHPVDSTHH